MKRIISILICACLAAAMLTACGKGGENSRGGVSEPGLLKVVLIDGGDRYARSAGGNVEGMEPELASSVAQSLGLNVQYTVVGDRDTFFAGLQNGQYDLGFGRVSETDPECSGLVVSRSYGRGALFLVTSKYNYMNGLTALVGGKAGISSGVEGISDKVPGIENVEREGYDSLEELSAAVESGAVDAAVVNEREAVSMISKSLQAQQIHSSPVENYVAVMPKGTKLKAAVDQAIGQYYNTLIGIGQEDGEQADSEGMDK